MIGVNLENSMPQTTTQELPTTRRLDKLAPLYHLDTAVESIEFNFTNECNLRCVYCPQGSHEEGFHAETSQNQIDDIVSYIKTNNVKKASIGYYGETTMVEGWQEVCQELIDLGVELTIVSNFSRVLSKREFEVLSGFHEIQVSIDIVDPKILRSVRKAVDVRSIIYNCQNIQAHAILNGRPSPKMIWTGVLTGEVVMGLSHLVATAATCSIRHVNFNSVGYFEGAQAGAMHVCDLPDREFIAGAAEIERALALAKDHGVQLKIQDHSRIMRKLVSITGKTRVLDNGHYLENLGALKSSDRIFIYGSGAPGRYIAAKIKARSELDFQGFLDSSWSGEVDKIKVFTFEDYATDRRPNDLILVCSGAYDQIEKTLQDAGVEDYLDAREIYLCEAGRSQSDPDKPGTEKSKRQGIQGNFAMVDDEGDDLAQGLTRLCDSPWSQVYTDPKGEVYSCCQRGEVMGKLNSSTAIGDVLNADSYKELRKQLLTGEKLNPECSQCLIKPPTSPENMQRWIGDKIRARKQAGRTELPA